MQLHINSEKQKAGRGGAWLWWQRAADEITLHQQKREAWPGQDQDLADRRFYTLLSVFKVILRRLSEKSLGWAALDTRYQASMRWAGITRVWRHIPCPCPQLPRQGSGKIYNWTAFPHFRLFVLDRTQATSIVCFTGSLEKPKRISINAPLLNPIILIRFEWNRPRQWMISYCSAATETRPINGQCRFIQMFRLAKRDF